VLAGVNNIGKACISGLVDTCGEFLTSVSNTVTVHLKNVAEFLPPPPPPVGDVVVVTTPVDFKAMAAKRNFCPETQHLLSGSTLIIAFS
jgi:hypothetical protein